MRLNLINGGDESIEDTLSRSEPNNSVAVGGLEGAASAVDDLFPEGWSPEEPAC